MYQEIHGSFACSLRFHLTFRFGFEDFTMSRFHLLLITAILGCLDASRVVADDGYDLIPVSASAVVRMKTPDSTIADLAEFVNKVQPGIGDAFLLGQKDSLLGGLIENPTLDGVFRNSDWYVATFLQPTGRPDVVFLVPTSDPEKVRAAVTPGHNFAVKGQFIAYSKSVERIKDIEACFSGDVAAVATLLDQQNREMLNSGHITLLVNGNAMKDVYSATLEDMEVELDRLIDSIANQVPAGKTQADLTYVWDMYRSFGRSLIQAVRDSDSLVVRVDATDKSLQIDQLLSVAKGSQTDLFVSTQPPGDLASLKSVPEGQVLYFGSHGDITPLMSAAERMMASLPVSVDTRSQFEKSFAIIKEAKFGAIVGGGNLFTADDSGMQYFGISEVTTAAKIREGFASLGDKVEYEIGGIKQTQSYRRDAETIDGLSVDLLEFEQTVPPEMDPLGMQQAMHKKLYGPEGMLQRLVVKGDTLYQTMGGGIDQMKRLLKSGEWADSKLIQARARMPQQANILLLTDLPSMLHQFVRLIVSTGTLPIPVTEDQLNGLKIEPSYSGFSVTAQPQQLFLRTDLPIETFKGFVQVAFYVQQVRANGL